MFIDLKSENNLRGYSFEHISKMVLRRLKKNNFIFVTAGFDSIDEIIKKYRLNDKKIKYQLNILKGNMKKLDIIEFELGRERIIDEIILYDVKTNYHRSKKNYFEFCESNYHFIKKIRSSIRFYIISIILSDNWRFSFNIKPFDDKKVRVYSRFKP